MMGHSTPLDLSRSRVLAHVLTLALAGVVAAGCSAAGGEEGELWDEGPTDEEEATAQTSEAATAMPRIQVPFPCNQAWSGQTRTNHSPLPSIDFNRGGDEGDAVSAAAPGTVSRVENLGNRSYGRWIEINHGGGWTTRYAHLSGQRVTRGQTVKQGEVIGNVGNTGGSQGAHLHFELRRSGTPVRIAFNGAAALYYGTRTYTSRNACGGSGGGGGVRGVVDTAGIALTIRSGAGTGFASRGTVADGTAVTIRCQKRGESVTGTFGTSPLWDNIGTGFISDAYVKTGSDGQVAPTCP